MNLHVWLKKRKKKNVFFFSYFFNTFLATFTKVKSERELVLLNFYRHEHFLKDHWIGKCVGVSDFLFFFFALCFSPFLLCRCWPNQLKWVLKTVFHYTAKSMHLACIFMQHVLHLHIWTEPTSLQTSHISFCFHKNGCSVFDKNRVCVSGAAIVLLFTFYFIKGCFFKGLLGTRVNSEHRHKGQRSHSFVSAWSFDCGWNQKNSVCWSWRVFDIALFHVGKHWQFARCLGRTPQYSSIWLLDAVR